MADAPAPASDADPTASSPAPSPAEAAPAPISEPVAAAVSEPAGLETSAPASEPAATQPELEPEPVATQPAQESEPAAGPGAVLAAPEPEPTPEPVLPSEPAPAVEPGAPAVVSPAPVRFNGVPEVAATLEVPASAPGGGDDGDGGEWELLLQKLRHWLASGQLQQQWQSARGPLSLLAGLIALLLVLRVYGALLGVLDSLPLVPGLLELVGVIAVTRFGLRRLVRSEERQAVLRDLQQRWRAFRGKA